MTHIAVVVDDAAETLELYLDGASVGRATMTGTLADLHVENSCPRTESVSPRSGIHPVTRASRNEAAPQTAAFQCEPGSGGEHARMPRASRSSASTYGLMVRSTRRSRAYFSRSNQPLICPVRAMSRVQRNLLTGPCTSSITDTLWNTMVMDRRPRIVSMRRSRRSPTPRAEPFWLGSPKERRRLPNSRRRSTSASPPSRDTSRCWRTRG